MSAHQGQRRSRRLAGAVAVGAGAAGAVAWALQHRRVSGSVATEEDFRAEGLEMPNDVRRRVVEADDGTRLSVLEAGSGPAIVLLHGFMLDSTVWASQFRDLARTNHLIAVDQRGHGGSEIGSGFSERDSRSRSAQRSRGARRDATELAIAGEGAKAIRRLSSDLLGVLDELEVSDALLVGHSMGGMVALQLAQDHPEVLGTKITGLVLSSTMAGPFAKLPGWTATARLAAPVSARAVLVADRAAARAFPLEDVRFWVSRIGFGADATAAQVRFVERLHRSTKLRTLSGLLPSLAVFDLSDGLGSVEVPALVVVGSHDRLTPPRQARRMAGSLPHAQLVELARCGHMPMIERPHEFSRLLEEFSAKIAAK